MSWELPPAPSPVGPGLLGVGVGALAAAGLLHGMLGWPTILPVRRAEDGRSPSLAERISVHLLIYGIWAVAFGAVVWRGVPAGAIDPRIGFERHWPVVPAAEWIYLSVYVVPLAMPWLAPTRGALRRYAWELCVLLAISVTCFLLLPFASPPREFTATTLAGRILAWETGRADFGAASLPSFHVFWGLLCARLLASRGGWIAGAGIIWAAAVTVSCVANGAHALADVAASLLIYLAVGACAAPGDSRRTEMRPNRNPARAPAASAPSPK